MKVMFLVNIPSPYRVSFFNELSKYCDLTVVFEKRKSDARDGKWLSNEGIHFKSVFLDGVKIKNRLVYSEQLKALAREKWDIVILGVYMITSAIYLNRYYCRTKKPFFIQADGGLIKNDKWLIGTIKRGLISKATGWITSGPRTTEYFVHYGAKRNNCYEYPFSSIRNMDIVDSLAVRKQRMRVAKEKLGVSNRKVVLAIGQFIHRKGFDVLLRAVPQLCNNVDIYFVGGIPGAEYERIIEEIHLNNVYFEGFKTKTELTTYYEAADVFVLPTREDIWGLVINEAMGYGLPVITTDNCVAGLELIENKKNGYIVKTENVDELATAINLVLENDTLCDQMSMNNIEKIKGYTIETMALAHKEIFDELVSKEGK